MVWTRQHCTVCRPVEIMFPAVFGSIYFVCTDVSICLFLSRHLCVLLFVSFCRTVICIQILVHLCVWVCVHVHACAHLRVCLCVYMSVQGDAFSHLNHYWSWQLIPCGSLALLCINSLVLVWCEHRWFPDAGSEDGAIEESRKVKALRVLALRVAAHLHWDLAVLEKG